MSSEQPGDVVAQVTRNVYDADQEDLLIPRGSRLVGRFGDAVALGERRVLLVWTQLQVDGRRSYLFPGLPSTDERGASGVPGRVRNHLFKAFGAATLLSIVSAGVQLSQPRQPVVIGQAASTEQVAAAALGQQLGSLSTEVLRRYLDVRPTITLEAGNPAPRLLERRRRAAMR